MVKKMIGIVLLIILLISIDFNYTKLYAASTVDDVMTGADSFLSAGSDTVIQDLTLKNTSDFVFNLLLAIAIVIAVIIGMVIGIKLMMAGIEEKAKLKEALMPYFVGCFVVFGAFGIWKLAVTILSKL